MAVRQQRLKELEQENAKRKRLVASPGLDNLVLKDLAAEKSLNRERDPRAQYRMMRTVIHVSSI